MVIVRVTSAATVKVSAWTVFTGTRPFRDAFGGEITQKGECNLIRTA
jgi:hypothetical protein